MKSIRQFTAVMLMLWTPLFFSGAAYAATQMELANASAQQVVAQPHSCHKMSAEAPTDHSDIKHHSGDSNCQHCGFCVSFVAPLNEIFAHVIHQPTLLAFNTMWVSSTHNITPDHRPPINA